MAAPHLSIQCEGHNDSVVQLSYSKPSDIGYSLASAGLDGVAMLRNGKTGAWMGSFLEHNDGVTGVCLNGNASIMATSSADNSACLWDAKTRLVLRKFHHPGEVTCVDLDTSSTRIVTGCRGPKPFVSLFDVESLDQTPLETFQGHPRGVRNVTFCRDDRVLLTSSYDRTVRMWDRLSGKETNSVALPHHAKSVELHKDGKIVTIAYGTSLVFLDVRKFQVMKHHKMEYKMAGAALHPFKETYVCARSNGRIYKYDYATADLLDIYTLMGVCCVTYSPDGQYITSSSGTGSITIWPQISLSTVEDMDDSLG